MRVEGSAVPSALLCDYFDLLPEHRPGDDDDLWMAGAQDAIREFRAAVRAKYTEGTLQRLARAEETKLRRAAVLALGLVGTMASNAVVASGFRDADAVVRRFATDAAWEIWFRAGTADHNSRLRAAACDPDAVRARAELDQLIEKAPDFAEVYNQRAIWFFKRGEFGRAVDDCEAVLRLNSYHFGAAAGLGECFLKLHKPRSAVRAFKQALEINPELRQIAELLETLEATLDRDPEEK